MGDGRRRGGAGEGHGGRELLPGLYEDLVTRELGEALVRLEARGWGAGRRDLDGEGAPEVLARYVGRHLFGALRSLPGEGTEQVAAQIGLANRLLDFLKDSTAYPVVEGDAVDEPGRLLLHLVRPSGDLGANQPPARPVIPLRSSVLLVNGHRDQGIGRAVASELASAQRVDLLCAFVRWTGFLVIRDALAEFLRSGRELRVLTTVYTGATQRRALDELCRLGARIKVSYETDQTRLHAKAWLFHRDRGASPPPTSARRTSPVRPCVDGLEWNVRASETDNSGIVARFRAVFDQYWAEAEFQPYDPEADGDRLERALRRQTGEGRTAAIELPTRGGAQGAPAGDPRAARRRAAAAGTGRTWSWPRPAPARPGSRPSTTRACGASGARRASSSWPTGRRSSSRAGRSSRWSWVTAASASSWWTAHRPEAGRHVFASIQSLRAERLAGLRPDAYEVVIVDEFHHAAAPSYDALLRTLSAAGCSWG